MAIGVAAGVLLGRARRRPDDERVVRHQTRSQRNAALAKVGGRAGGAFAVHQARKAFATAERREELDRSFELQTAEQVTAALGQMKGALMKLGQMASYLDQGLPEPVREALSQLQQDAPPMSAALVDGVVREQLGRAPEELFAQWDAEPIASASIGQVHRAITHDGMAVAVKVQYPGVEAAIRADLENTDLLFAIMGQLFPGLEPRPLVEELSARLLEELDYELEAEHQSLFADYYEDHPFIHVPKVRHDLSSGRVLTTELATGSRWDEMLTWSQAERDLAAETLYRFAFGSLYQFLAFNGDPHPGNYLFRPGGQVTFLDYGLCKRFTQDEIAVFVDMIEAMVLERDVPRFREIIERVGVLTKGSKLTDEQIGEYFGHFYDFVMVDEVSTIDPEYASETVRRFFDYTGPYTEVMKASNLPPSMVIIQRINLGLYALFAQMGATGNWRRLAEEVWPFVDAAPSTPMGEAEAAWRHRRHGT